MCASLAGPALLPPRGQHTRVVRRPPRYARPGAQPSNKITEHTSQHVAKMPRTGPAAAALVLVLLPPPQSDRTAQAVSLPGAKLQALVDHAIASGSKSLTIPPGDYLFNTTRANFEIHGAEGLQILAAGATVWLWPGSFVDVRSSRRTTVSGLTVDYDPPCFSQLVVTAVNSAARSFSATVEPGFLPPDAAKHPQFNATEVKVIYWSAQTRLLLPQPSANP